MLLLDSDVLFFAPPVELLWRIDDPRYCKNTANADVATAYTTDARTAGQYTGVELIERFNSGLGLIHRGSMRLDWIEEFLGIPGIVGHFWRIEQTLFALCSSRFGAEHLPPEYDVYLSRGLGNRPSRHYLGAIRHLMYGEGIARLVREGMLRVVDRIKVLMMPDYRTDNPYQDLLSRGLEAEGCRVVFPKGYRRVFPLSRAVHGGRGVDILHLHWTGPYLKGRGRPMFAVYAAKFLADLALVRRAGCRIVWTLHNLLPHEARFRRLELFLRRGICRIASAVIVHGACGRDEAVAALRCPAEKIAVVPHGHYRAAYGPAMEAAEARRRLGLPLNARVLLFFGFLRPYKGLESLIAAWRKLCAVRCGAADRGAVARPSVRGATAGHGRRFAGRSGFGPFRAARRRAGLLQRGGRGGIAFPRGADLRQPAAGDDLRPARHRAAAGRTAGNA